VDFEVVHQTVEAKLGGDINTCTNNNPCSIPAFCQTKLAR